MIEKLWDATVLGENPQYRAIMDELAVLENTLLQNRDSEERDRLHRMIDTFAQLEGVAIYIAFQQGFSIAVYLVIGALCS